jgi:siroheme synthase-like protein
MLDGRSIVAVIVGGGHVAERKARALHECGARIRVVAPATSALLTRLAASSDRVDVRRTAYSGDQLSGATLVVAATDDSELNARVASDARAQGCLVNVADAPALGNFVTPAVHRAGDVVVAVTAGGVPAAAARLRDVIARLIDGRVAAAVALLASLRRDLLARGQRDRWTTASAALVGDDFPERAVEPGFAARVAEWR